MEPISHMLARVLVLELELMASVYSVNEKDGVGIYTSHTTSVPAKICRVSDSKCVVWSYHHNISTPIEQMVFEYSIEDPSFDPQKLANDVCKFAFEAACIGKGVREQ